jgi:hypothetical protein
LHFFFHRCNYDGLLPLVFSLCGQNCPRLALLVELSGKVAALKKRDRAKPAWCGFAFYRRPRLSQISSKSDSGRARQASTLPSARCAGVSALSLYGSSETSPDVSSVMQAAQFPVAQV